LRYVRKLFGYFLIKTHGITGAIVPIRKKKTRGLINVDEIADPWRITRTVLVGLTLGELKGRTDDTFSEWIRSLYLRDCATYPTMEI
jgi:hypothetical protein